MTKLTQFIKELNSLCEKHHIQIQVDFSEIWYEIPLINYPLRPYFNPTKSQLFLVEYKNIKIMF